MNYKGKHKRAPLEACPKCGMHSGKRKVSVAVPEKFFILCESCGHITRPHKDQAAATTEWNLASRNKEGQK